MIVICTSCQAKFRIADERIGPRGAKVRCSRCQTIFAVHPDLGSVPLPSARPPPRTPPPPASGLDLEARSARPRPAASARPAAPKGAARPVPSAGSGSDVQRAAGRVVPPPLPPLPPPPSGDPFAPAPSAPPDPFDGDPFAASAPPAAPGPFDGDPFAAQAPPAAPGPFDGDPFIAQPPPDRPDPFAGDPFASVAPVPAGAGPLDGDPFAAAPPGAPGLDGDPFAAPSPPRSSLPVTDLSDLLGPAPASPPPPEPGWSDAAPPDPFGSPALDGAAGSEGLALEAPAPRPPPLEHPDPPWARSGEELGLALEDRPTPPQVEAPASLSADLREPALDTGAERFGVPSEPSPAMERGASFEGLELGAGGPGDAASAPASGEREGDAFTAQEPRAPAPPAGREAPRAAPSPPAAPAPEERIPGGRGSRIRAVAVNAVSLFALLAVALGMLVMWRAGGPLGPGALRPSAILSSLRGEPASAAPFAAQDVHGGVYERERAAPVLFVRGSVVSRAPAPVRGVKVSAEIVRDGRVLARGEALAGAAPTPEELHGAADAAALAAVRRAAAARAPREVAPGDVIPFLIAIGDAPADVEGASVRVTVAPSGGGSL